MTELSASPTPPADQSPQAPRDADPAAMYIVGIGASAGGLDAFIEFFRNMPPDSGMAFVLVQHLDPDQPSLLSDLLASQTAMPVLSVVDKMVVLPNHVYVIPSNAALTLSGGVLSLAAPAEARGHRMLIDQFMTSLAADQGSRAIGIVLSGANSDGTFGLAAIQDAGGLTVAQLPESALFPMMPRSAIDHHIVDHVLPAHAMPALLRSYAVEGERPPLVGGAGRVVEMSGGLKGICAILRHITGHDFSQYKPATLLRRIGRRMQLAHVTELDAYAEQLRHDRPEAEQLFQDLLISVTGFFRDPAAFEALADLVFPTLFKDRGADAPVRVWVTACATGEEAYSIAMLLSEYMDRLADPPPIQMFASDIDETALAFARRGRYDAGISAQVSAERLTRFFTSEGDAYQVTPALRDLCLFSTHNLISDPPFARMDLIVCRNLMIYFAADLQQQLVPLLHYALRSGGSLFLGSAENVAAYPELFRPVAPAHRIFQRNELLTRAAVPFPLTAPSRRSVKMATIPRRASPSDPPDLGTTLERIMLHDYVSPAVVVDAGGGIVHFFGRTGVYLDPAAGVANLDILAMVRSEIRPALQSALRNARHTLVESRVDVTIAAPAGPQQIALIVRPLADFGQTHGLLMIIFQEVGPGQRPVGDGEGQPEINISEQLADELRTTRAELETTIVDLQETNIDLTTANEELLSFNEEIQSANEELQTSKEEIQSINEELQTVNAELSRKIDELDRVNGDIANLFASTQIPAIFLRADGRIARFTPAAIEVFRLMALDIGRPITDIAPRFHSGDLLALVTGVLHSLIPHEEAIHRPEPEAWWMMRIRPYRTLANIIDGVVITFTDITNLKRAEESREVLLHEMQAARLYAEQIVANVIEPLLILDADLSVRSANPAYYQHFRVTAGETDRRSIYDLLDGAWDDPQLRARLNMNLPMSPLDLEIARTFPNLGRRAIRLQASSMVQVRDTAPLILLTIADVTEIRHAASVVAEARDALERRVEERTHELAVVNVSLQAEIADHRRSEVVRQQLLLQLVTAQEEERRRIARELHDQLGQDLAGLILGLKALQNEGAQPPAAERVGQLQELATQIGQEVRTLALQLRPPALDDLGLSATLTHYVEQWSARALVAVDMQISGLDTVNLPLAIETTLYRLVQEALTNVLKHASATTVSVIIEHQIDEVRMILEDDGVGFDVAARLEVAVEERLGLLGMDERVAQLGGTLTIESAPGSGTSIFIRLPHDAQLAALEAT